jgi:ComF family protein
MCAPRPQGIACAAGISSRGLWQDSWTRHPGGNRPLGQPGTRRAVCAGLCGVPAAAGFGSGWPGLRTLLGAVRLVSPPWCDICGEPRMSWRTPSEGPACARCVDNPPDFDQARAYGLYEGTLRQIVQARKYQGHQSLGAHLGALMRQGDGGLLSRADAVVPVPLHPWRRLRRGFNQADELARHLGLPVWRALGRRSRGRPQAGLSAEHRRANVEDAYGLSLDWSGLLRRRRPSHVVLIDDVMTTGATLDACSRVLRDAGVEWIGALTAARAASPTGGPGGPTPRLQPPPAHRLSRPRHR